MADLTTTTRRGDKTIHTTTRTTTAIDACRRATDTLIRYLPRAVRDKSTQARERLQVALRANADRISITEGDEEGRHVQIDLVLTDRERRQARFFLVHGSATPRS